MLPNAFYVKHALLTCTNYFSF